MDDQTLVLSSSRRKSGPFSRFSAGGPPTAPTPPLPWLPARPVTEALCFYSASVRPDLCSVFRTVPNYFLLLRKNGPTERIWMKFAAGNHCHELINDYILAENGTKTTEQQDIRRISLLPYCPNGFWRLANEFTNNYIAQTKPGVIPYIISR